MKRLLRKRVLRPVCRRLYRDPGGGIDRSVLVAGAGRSGTTWLADILGSIAPSRVMFEPFHSEYVPEFRGFHYFHYAPPAETDERLLAYCTAVFSGAIRNAWIDHEVTRLRPRYRVIKEIRANFFLMWIRERFPRLPILFVIRHPCAVVLSRMRSGWAGDSDIAPFLAQEKLIADHLRERLDLIRGARTEEEKHAIVWCVSNLIPLAQFGPGELDVFFYERLCSQPEPEIRKMVEILAAGPLAAEKVDVGRALRRIDVPSPTTTRSSAVVTGEDRVGRWRKDLSPRQIDRILAIVDAFRLGHLYGDSLLPRTDL
ncbi:MAG: sulfotransferase [Gemmatimonadota bacterium]